MNSVGNLGRDIGAKIETSALYALLPIILLSAIPNGTVDDWVITSFVFLVCLCAVMRAGGSLLTGNFSIAEPLLLLPLSGILLLALVQYGASTDLINSPAFLKNAASVAPYQTKKFLLILTALLVSLEILFRFCKTPHRLRILVSLVILIGAMSALLALIRQILPIDNTIFWKSVFGQSAAYGQFINRNHFAFLMEMNLGLISGLLLTAGLSKGLKLWCLSVALISLVAAILSNSRGAVISLIGLGVFIIFGYFITRKTPARNYGRRNRVRFLPGNHRVRTILLSVVFSLIFIVAGIFTIALVGGDPIADRLETVQGEMREPENDKIRRSKIWQSALRLIQANALTGVGFGGFGAAVTRYDDSSGERSLDQAHNDYLEILANGGILAFTLMFCFFALVIYRTREQLRGGDRFRRASSFGAASGMFAAALHSMVDFGLQTIINALVFLMLIVIATARIDRREEV